MSGRNARYMWLDEVRDHVREHTLSSSASHVAFALAVHYMNGHQEAWPSIRELAATTGYASATVKRALHELEQRDLLEHRHGPPARTFGNVYRLRTGSQ